MLQLVCLHISCLLADVKVAFVVWVEFTIYVSFVTRTLHFWDNRRSTSYGFFPVNFISLCIQGDATSFKDICFDRDKYLRKVEVK